MDPALIGAIGLLVGALSGAAVALLRTKSDTSIKETDAAMKRIQAEWDVVRAAQLDHRTLQNARYASLLQQNEKQEARITDLETKKLATLKENLELQVKVKALEAEVATLKESNAAMQLRIREMEQVEKTQSDKLDKLSSSSSIGKER